MGPLGELSSTLDSFRARLDQLETDQWDLPTPCTEWDVAELVRHVIAGNVMVTAIVRGADHAAVVSMLDDYVLTADARDEFDQSSASMLAAFGEPGALDRTVAHAVGEIPGVQLPRFRTGDVLVHTWDLARAAGMDEQLHPGIVRSIWADVEPMAPTLGMVGSFGAGPSGALGPDAPAQELLLDAFGRRP